ncbi:hypothetical protein T484DRAFT_1789338 [Baffinella frigidus]|nr:hypothetical protein T484DRAFT_1789338 [Cryptophyta sp. CCMP2293]
MSAHAAKVLLAAACVLATVISGVDAAVKLTFTGAAKAMTPTTFKVLIGTDAGLRFDGLRGDRLEIHLPGFGGAYNSFGARHEAALPAGSSLPEVNGITGLAADGRALTGTVFASAEWDAAREVLKLTVAYGGPTVRGVQVNSRFLRLAYSSSALPSGLGPLP